MGAENYSKTITTSSAALRKKPVKNDCRPKRIDRTRHTRQYSTATDRPAARAAFDQLRSATDAHSRQIRSRWRTIDSAAVKPTRHAQSEWDQDRNPGADRHHAVQKLADSAYPYHELRDAPIPRIYDALRILRNRPMSLAKVADFVTYLVVKRGQPPSPFLYETLIRTAADTSASAGSVEKLLREMEAHGIRGSPALYHGALAALAVHPSYRLRNHVLATMQELWMPVSREGTQHVLLGLLRDGQYELAFEKLEALAEDRADIDPWVYDIFIFCFARLGFLDEAVKMTHHRLQHQGPSSHGHDDVPLNLLHYLLDACSSAFHHEGTLYLWQQLVDTDRVNPSDGILVNTLNTATRHLDNVLASAAIDRLTDRGTKLQRHHYEAMVECYAGQKDVAKALQVLCIMAKSGISPTLGSTRPVYLCLKEEHGGGGGDGLLDAAIRALRDLRAEYDDVPVLLLDGLIEAAVDSGRHAAAMDMYRHVRDLCSEPPGLKTVQLLLRDCPDVRMAIFLVAEQPALALQANPAAYDRVIHACADQGRLDRVFRFLDAARPAGAAAVSEEAVEAEWWISRKTVLAVVRACFASRDDRVWPLIEEAKRRNMALDAAIAQMKQELEGGEDISPGARVVQVASEELQRHGASDPAAPM